MRERPREKNLVCVLVFLVLKIGPLFPLGRKPVYELQHCFRTLSVFIVGLMLIGSESVGRMVLPPSSFGSRSCF